MVTIAIITENDTIWALSAWGRAIPLLREYYCIKTVWICEKKFSKIPNNKILQWYFATFGLINTVLLGAFAFLNLLFKYLRHFINAKKESTDFNNLCLINKIKLCRTQSPNDKLFVDYVRENQIDIVIIMVDHIIKGPLLSAPRIGIINKHAALLPLNKGIFPYFWAFLYDTPQGITFHKIDKAIDEGVILFQKEIKKSFRSMISFYFYVFSEYPKMLLTAVDNLTKAQFVSYDGKKGSYYSLPTRNDYREFRKKGGKIIVLNDLLLSCKM
jgi:hypothetical protein